MNSFLKKFTKAKLISILERLNDSSHSTRWKKANLIDRIQEYGIEQYTKVLSREQLIVGLEFYSLSNTGDKDILCQRLFEYLMYIDNRVIVNPPRPEST